MFKATEVERKIGEINLPYRYANNSYFVQNFRPLFLAVSSAIVLGLVRN